MCMSGSVLALGVGMRGSERRVQGNDFYGIFILEASEEGDGAYQGEHADCTREF